MNNFLFRTGGDWETTYLHNHGQEVLAAQLFVELQAGRDGFGEPNEGGIQLGGDLNALVRLQDDPEEPYSILPGRLELQFPGHSVVLENGHPHGHFEYTNVWFNNRNVTEQIIELYVDINAVDNVVQAFITIFKPRWFGDDEVATFQLI